MRGDLLSVLSLFLACVVNQALHGAARRDSTEVCLQPPRDCNVYILTQHLEDTYLMVHARFATLHTLYSFKFHNILLYLTKRENQNCSCVFL